MHYYIIDYMLLEHTLTTKEQWSKRSELNRSYVGQLQGGVRYSPELELIVAEVGPPPAWFKMEGPTLSEVTEIGVAARAR